MRDMIATMAASVALAVALLVSVAEEQAQAQSGDSGLYIELNKVEDGKREGGESEDGGGGCLATFVVRNGLGHTLDRFRIDLYVFDREDVVTRQVLLDMAPLRRDKTTVSRFSLSPRSCAEIGRLLVNDLPQCRRESGETLDCLAALSVASKDRIELFK